MFRFKKIGSLLVAVGLTVGMFSGCSNSDNVSVTDKGNGTTSNSSTTASLETKAPIVEITQFAYDRGSIPSSEGTLEDNWYTKELNKITTEKLGVKVKYVTAPNAQREQKLASLLASGDAPDICFSYDNAIQMNYSKSGGLTDLAPLLDKYGSNLKKVAGADRIEQSKINGNLNRILSTSVPISNTTWIRKDWLDKLSLKAPTNPQEFYEMLKAFKEKDPGKAGVNLMPFAFMGGNDTPFNLIQFTCLQGFLKEPPTKEKLVTPFQLWPETKEMYRYMNKLYNEKLLGEFIIDKDQSQYKQKIIKGELGATVSVGHWMGHSAYGGLEDSLRKNVPDAHYIAAYPWKDSGVSEVIPTMYQFGYDSAPGFFIPKSSKAPDAAFKFMDFMATDEYLLLSNFGILDVDYKIVDGVPVKLNPDAFKDHVGWIQPAYNGITVLNSNNLDVYKKTFLNFLVGDTAKEEVFKNVPFGSDIIKYSKPVITADQPMFAKYGANLTTKWASFEAQIVLCPVSEFDKKFDDALNTWKAEGGNDIAKEVVDLYKAQYGK